MLVGADHNGALQWNWNRKLSISTEFREEGDPLPSSVKKAAGRNGSGVTRSKFNEGLRRVGFIASEPKSAMTVPQTLVVRAHYNREILMLCTVFRNAASVYGICCVLVMPVETGNYG